MTPRLRRTLIWSGVAAALVLPIGFTIASPYMAYRDAVYVVGGFSGVVALALLLPQALLIGGLLPLSAPGARRLHRWTGGALAALVGLHILGLWLTSPQDMADALLLRAPTLFSLWGVFALWALVAITGLALFRRRIAPRHWRLLHGTLAAVFVAGSLAHALPIIGTMEPITKAMLCLMVALATTLALLRRLRPGPWGSVTGQGKARQTDG